MYVCVWGAGGGGEGGLMFYAKERIFLIIMTFFVVNNSELMLSSQSERLNPGSIQKFAALDPGQSLCISGEKYWRGYPLNKNGG